MAEEELASLAEIFADDLEGESLRDVDAAFTEHRKRNKAFPTPAHILELLPECRKTDRQRLELPEITHDVKETAEYARQLFEKRRGRWRRMAMASDVKDVLKGMEQQARVHPFEPKEAERTA